MSTNDCVINYNYFSPSSEEARKIKSIVHNIYYASPSDSVVKLLVTKNKNVYQCQLRVVSPSFMEIINSESQDLIRSILSARKEISKKISNWKSKRFSNMAV